MALTSFEYALYQPVSLCVHNYECDSACVHKCACVYAVWLYEHCLCQWIFLPECVFIFEWLILHIVSSDMLSKQTGIQGTICQAYMRVPNLLFKYSEWAFQMSSKEGVLHRICVFSAWLCACMQMYLCSTQKKSDYFGVCPLLLCVCVAADARPLGGIWLSGRAIKWPVLCVCVCVCVWVCFHVPHGWGLSRIWTFIQN